MRKGPRTARRIASSPTDCPCGSGARYRDCCAPYHRGEREAATCEALMRSRYAAFSTGEGAYLYRTLHADHEGRARGEAEGIAQMRKASRDLRYMGLTILDSSADQVLFIARVFEKGRDRSFIELSDFEHDGTGHRYRSGLLRWLADMPGAESLTIAGFRERTVGD